MKKLKTWVLFTFLVLASQSGLAQQTEPTEKVKPILPGSILRVGFSPVNQMQSASFSPGINIDWEKPLSARVTFGTHLYRDLTSSSFDNYDERKFESSSFSRFSTFNDIRTSLSFSLNYYFKPYAYDGLYLSFRTNNAIAQAVQYHSENGSTPARGHSQMISDPRRGLYLGYRKVFDNGFFIDGSAGYAPSNNKVYNRRMTNDFLDFKLTLGWQLKLKKKK